jgi:hypothetical protein
MKKWIWGGAVAAALTLPLLLPVRKETTLSVNIAAPAAAILRRISEPVNMATWWPGHPPSSKAAATTADEGGWAFGEGTYRFVEAYVGSITLGARHGSLPTEISIGASGLSVGNTVLTLHASSQLSGNPYVRLWQSLSYGAMRSELGALLDSLAARFSDPVNLYGFHIERRKVTDGNLVSLKQAFDHTPSTEEVYGLIARVRAHVAARGAKETNPPMMNVYSEDGGITLTAQVAVPTDRELPAEGPFLLKRMLPGGNILMAEVTGGPTRVDSCRQAVEDYVKDRNMMSPAIPFLSLVTDRMAEKDSNRWVTRVYYPVF